MYLMQHEQQREHGASFIECYMKEYRASKQEAYAEAQRQIANAWKDINNDYLHATQIPTFFLERFKSFRLVDILQEDDFTGFTNSLKTQSPCCLLTLSIVHHVDNRIIHQILINGSNTSKWLLNSAAL
ncbi:hypothetical protein H5410_064300 [Solanum commersonii]|uniref:Terpene synthase metal-binding domain-containing protein n=1 Tax=Solanum commersonii TaxID=4109 RepID=A0A9J5VZN9_SOLCO|nr:hypothetical protein H5410_064300 [Solanum commersonii]